VISGVEVCLIPGVTVTFNEDGEVKQPMSERVIKYINKNLIVFVYIFSTT